MSIFIVTNNRTFIIYSICEFPQARNRNVVNVMTDWYVYISFAIHYIMTSLPVNPLMLWPSWLWSNTRLATRCQGSPDLWPMSLPKLPPGRSRSCSAPATPATPSTPYGGQGETTRHGPGGYTRVVKLQHSATEHYIQTPAFLLFYLCTCARKLLQIYLEIYGKLFIAWLLLRPNICLMAVTIFLSRYSLFWCYIQLLVPLAEKIIKYPLGHLVKTLNTGSWKCHITS